MPTSAPVSQLWHKGFWSQKERKRLNDEYAVGELERDKERIKYASDLDEGRGERGDNRRFKHEGDMTFKQNQDRLRELEREYQLRGDLEGVRSGYDLLNRKTEMDIQAAHTQAEADRANQRRRDEFEASTKARIDEATALADLKDKRNKEALHEKYKLGLMQQHAPLPSAAVNALADVRANSALNAMQLDEMKRESGLNKVLTEDPKLGIPGYIGAETRRDLAEGERAAGQAVVDRLFPEKGGRGGPTLAVPAPGTRIKLGGGRRKTNLEELDERYNVR